MMRCTAPVYEYVCPKCLANIGSMCIRIRKIRRTAPEILLDAHRERYDVWRSWTRPKEDDVA